MTVTKTRYIQHSNVMLSHNLKCLLFNPVLYRDPSLHVVDMATARFASSAL